MFPCKGVFFLHSPSKVDYELLQNQEFFVIQSRIHSSKVYFMLNRKFLLLHNNINALFKSPDEEIKKLSLRQIYTNNTSLSVV